MKRSKGEEAYAQVFQFKAEVNTADHETLRDYLYKIAYNYNEAYEYLGILEAIDQLDILDSKANLVFRIQGMALQCLTLSMRRLTDRTGNRSLQKFIPKFIKPVEAEIELQKIDNIYSHYKDHATKGVAHQDTWSIKQVLNSFPDTKVILKDLKSIECFYYKIVKEICTNYIGISSNHSDYRAELQKLKTESSK